MKKSLFLSFITIGLFLSSCGGEPRIDGSSMEAYEKSIKKVCANMPEDKKKELASAILKIGLPIAGGSITWTPEEKAKKISPEVELRKTLHGKSASEIIDVAAKINLNK